MSLLDQPGPGDRDWFLLACLGALVVITVVAWYVSGAG